MRFFMNDQEQWHRWFAWFPVRVDENEVRWLEIVERRLYGDAYASFYEHRALPDKGVVGVCMMEDPPRVRTWINGGSGHQPRSDSVRPRTTTFGSASSPPPPPKR